MGLLSIFQRNRQAAAKPANSGRGGKPAARQAPLANSRNPADTAEAVREARARARRRLMGATVLLLIGVIGFPLLFETQPRPIPVDLPIEIPARNAPGVVDATSTTRAHGSASTATLAASSPTPESVSYDARPSAAAPASSPASTPPARRSAFASLAAALTPSAARTSDVPASVATMPALPGATVAQARPAPRLAAPAPAPAVPASTPSPAAILAGAPSTRPSDAVSAGGRFVVQVGAFTDDTKIREVRAKVEKIGLKTYTQQVDTPGGKRVRVRVGPYATKAEADRIASKIKADGLPAAAVLAL